MQALDGYKVCHTMPRVKMEVHSPTSVPRSLSPIENDGQYSNYSPVLSNSSPSSTSFSSPSRHRLKRDHDYDYVNVNITPLKMDPYSYEAHSDSWNFLYNTDVTEQQQQQLLFNENDDMNAPQPYTIFPTSYGVSQGNLNQVGMTPDQQQWDMTTHSHGRQQTQPHAHHLQYPLPQSQAYYPVTPLSPGQPIPHMAPSGSSLMAMSPMSAHHRHQQQQQQGWSTSAPPQYAHGRIQHQHAPSAPSALAFAPVVPSSSSSSSRVIPSSSPNGGHHGNGNDSSDNEPSSSQPTLSTRYSTAMAWLTRTSPQLTPAQIQIARSIIRSSWWENESPEPELRANDELVVKGYFPVPGGSRFRAFLDEGRGWRCTFDHDGVVCGHGKGRMERALGTVRGFFVYKPVVCGGGCGSRCEQRFVSVEQCQKHVQKKRSGRVACAECGSSILPANMSRHRRACHAAAA